MIGSVSVKISFLFLVFQQHDEVGDSSGLLVSGIFSANKISGIDKVTTIAQKEGLKTALLDHFLALVAQLLKAEGIGMGNDGGSTKMALILCQP